jgi:membrane protease YdiL (CAAX protease family)
MKRIIDFFIFLLIISTSLLLPIIKISFVSKILVSIVPTIFSIYLFLKNKKLFVPSLFFTINALCSPFIFIIIEKNKLYIPQINFFIPIVIYLLIIFFIKDLKKEINWLEIGEFNKTTLILIVILICCSCTALLFWALVIEANLLRFQKYIPKIPLALLLLYGLIFPILNSLFEEFMARAVLFDGFSALFEKIVFVIILQAIIFALWHYKGFPGGIIGVIMVFIWSLFLGIIRYKSKGMLPPLVAHFFADLTIAIILFFIIILPNKLWI